MKSKRTPKLLREDTVGKGARWSFLIRYAWAQHGTFRVGGKGVIVDCICVSCRTTHVRSTQDVFQAQTCVSCTVRLRNERRKLKARERRASKKAGR